jgi:hypothetical protein
MTDMGFVKDRHTIYLSDTIQNVSSTVMRFPKSFGVDYERVGLYSRIHEVHGLRPAAFRIFPTDRVATAGSFHHNLRPVLADPDDAALVTAF